MPDKECVAEVLERAAEVLDERGWIRGSYGHPRVGMCSLGAINFTTYGSSFGKPSNATDEQVKLNWRAQSALRVQTGCGTIPDWNDHIARNKEQVLTAFREAAKKVREEV